MGDPVNRRVMYCTFSLYCIAFGLVQYVHSDKKNGVTVLDGMDMACEFVKLNNRR